MSASSTSPGNGPRSLEMVEILRRSGVDAGFVDRLKISYRPLICPFGPILDLLRQDDRVLDLGCGSGQFALLVSHFVQPASVYGLEVDERLAANANELLSRAGVATPFAFDAYDGVTLPDEVREATVVTMIDVLHHVPSERQRPLLESLHRVMSPGARLVLKDIDAASPLVLFNKLHDLVLSGSVGRELGLRVVLRVLDEIGFSVEQASRHRTLVYPHYLVLARKP
jgi:ubiquinone/menaquinone biosynthesis C-methylase UbiE